MSMQCFIPPPPGGHITVAECGSEFLYSAPDEVEATLNAAGIQQSWKDILIPSHPSDDTSPSHPHSHFVPVKEHHFKKAFNTWKDHGLVRAMEVLTGEEEEEEEGEGRGTLPIHQVLSNLLKGLLWLQHTYTKLTSGGVQMSKRELLFRYATNPFWSQCPLKTVALHPRLYVIALCRQDDVVVVLNLQSGAKTSSNKCMYLGDTAQSCVACMQWSSHSDNLLGVGVVGGVVLWHVDPLQFSSRPVCTLLQCREISLPITSLSWSPQGQLLAAGSPGHNPLLIWDVPMMTCTMIKRVQGGGVTMVNWSPDGGKLFTSHCSPLFRVWGVANWSCERWTHLSGICKAACWSPTGDHLLFALEGDPSLYHLSFSLDGTIGSVTNSAVKCADLTPTALSESPEISVGGCVQSMAWDRRGERLAVIFTADSPCSDKVAVFRTRCSPVLEVLPGGFVQGMEGEAPVGVDYHHGYKEGALLVTTWSSGRVSFIPLLFTFPPSQRALLPEDVAPLPSLLTPTSHMLFSQH